MEFFHSKADDYSLFYLMETLLQMFQQRKYSKVFQNSYFIEHL